MSAEASIRLSKSKFSAGVQCLKRLYLQVHQPELADEGDEEQEARLEQGQAVGSLAQNAFPGGVLVESGPDHLDGALARTTALMADSSVPAIFEATFQHSNVLVRVDILQRRRRNRWRLIEVKSSVDAKEHYLYDVAIQDHVVRKSGVDISSACLMHLNRDYRHDGQRFDTHKLFVTEDVTRRVRKLGGELPKLLRQQRRALAQREPPDIEPGPQCQYPYRCEFFDHCNPALPNHHISFLPRLGSKKQQDLLALGIELIDEIPDDFPLTEIQQRICRSVKTGRVWTSGTLAEELSRLKCPLYFMDFETLYPAIPRHAGTRPYAHIQFQWSVHRQIEQDATLEYFEFLANDDRDPRREFTESLCEALGKRGKIIVYNAGFESQRLGELADWLPEHARRIARIQERLWDLWPFIKRHLYHPRFLGSFSIKTVLPALVPGMTYDGMEVAHGDQAGVAWHRMISSGVSAGERQQLKSALLAYCRQDTLAMVRILDRVKTLALKTRAGRRNS